MDEDLYAKIWEILNRFGSTRSKTKELRQQTSTHASPYKTRAKRKSEEPPVDLREVRGLCEYIESIA